MNTKILITGAAGFIGFSLAKKLLESNFVTIGIDNLNDYYDTKLKKDRIGLLKNFKNFQFYKIDITNNKDIENLFNENNFNAVFHLAAQAGVRMSFVNPYKYYNSNIIGFHNIIEQIKIHGVGKFLYASSSSVYGNQPLQKLNEKSDKLTPHSLYAITKLFNENLANVFYNNYKVKSLGMRFFTVYGPYGRPDMAVFKFTENILKSKKTQLFNYGECYRDYTYIDDVVNSIILLYSKMDKMNSNQIYNIGNGQPITTISLMNLIQEKLNIKAKFELMPPQLGDVNNTFCDNKKLLTLDEIKFTNLKEGISNYINWHLNYYK